MSNIAPESGTTMRLLNDKIAEVTQAIGSAKNAELQQLQTIEGVLQGIHQEMRNIAQALEALVEQNKNQASK